MVPIDLSIAIPEGTYARIGKIAINPAHICSQHMTNAHKSLHGGNFLHFDLGLRWFAAPRSGLAWKHSIDVLAGVIDADYRGPVGIILFNHSDADFEVKAGDRVAQLIIEVIMTPEVVEVEDLDSTVRGAGGFGSTGV